MSDAPLPALGELARTDAELIAEFRRCCEEWGSTLSEAWQDRAQAAEDALTQRVLQLVALATGGAEDTARLDRLEEALWAGHCGNGLALMPSTLVGNGEKRINIIDLGDQDGSDLADEIADGPTLRDAIDALTPERPADEMV